ncbi:P2R1A-PPP2R2A-interacting phosphatase regulator 1-like [Amphibalanus amphitrite]|uniref:P2R1A-PPP2R2A-interacting phosphatase regulator 1-like n=1 Tax=Amphibalanus amphitrite TaxID=1232801 RepID=UPI001C900EE2|nr:P2R1A-PPP2R2A-interacting phosphatase regulator 1-like [Amphibalanus amphitrite]XP_043203937.1 P2R1A-PPP2R2A-interacting phosphatase regulator 1-like [Amphibalanus amphitrite]
MDVDPTPAGGGGPSQGGGGGGTGTASSGSTLKRSSSAPMINELVSQAQNISCSSTSASRGFGSPPLFSFGGSSQTHNPRVRRFSATFSPLAPPSSPGSSSGVRTPSRLMQIRQEAGLEDPEIKHERSVHAALQVSLSCEDLVVSSRDDSLKKSGGSGGRSVTDPLHLTMPQPSALPYGSTPSPTRPAGRPCFSPQIPERLRGPSFSPSPSPSPTRRSPFAAISGRRSMSPILRPSTLGNAVKRKLDDRQPAPGHNKRFHSGGAAGGGGGGGLLVPHPLVYSTSSLEAAVGALQAGSVGSVGTPESVSSVGSPGLSYKQDDSPRPMLAETMDSSSVFRPVESPRSSERRLKAVGHHEPPPPPPPPHKMDDSCVPMETGGGGGGGPAGAGGGAEKVMGMDVRPVAMEMGGAGDGKMPMDTGGQRLPGHAQYMRQSI